MKPLISIAAVSLLSACSMLPSQNQSVMVDSVLGNWQVLSINDQDPLKPVSLQLNDGELSGTDGCNRIFGKYSFAEGILTSQAASTRMACLPEVMKQASIVNSVIQEARVEQRGQQIVLSNDEHQLVLEQLP